ncbi:hypothetical protein KSE_30630 [Kitasatospora setae KM-6054]|uniref:Uncharacterized protein n=1 Tax=Kitasatospora setae (strain ATCC 33774 / DSM 43861 / JCM 3304 / KCC A-0304 / NBRC 14216 / KM-6054) TaxID=452652 RepID=E4NCE3_KITSK|nr:hypothetical protein KSE_30630 [Kitasatospora setae KM-6054]
MSERDGPYLPSGVGELVLDRESGEVVRFMGEWGGLLWVRPVGGGTETEVRRDGLARVEANSEGEQGC